MAASSAVVEPLIGRWAVSLPPLAGRPALGSWNATATVLRWPARVSNLGSVLSIYHNVGSSSARAYRQLWVTRHQGLLTDPDGVLVEFCHNVGRQSMSFLIFCWRVMLAK